MIDVARRPQAPVDLTEEGWNLPEVRAALLADFLHKCAYCERPINARDLQVDHRWPKARHPERACDWTNLLPACLDCNQRRRRVTPEGGWLSPGEGVEGRLVQGLRPWGAAYEACFEPTDPGDAPAANTAEELAHLHDQDPGRNPRSYDKAQALVEAATGQAQRAREALLTLLRMQRDPSTPAAALAQQQERVRWLYSRRAPYTMLARSLIPAAHRARLGPLLA